MSEGPRNKFMILAKAGLAAGAALLTACANTVTQHNAPKQEDVQRQAQEQKQLAAARIVPAGPDSPFIGWNEQQRLGNVASRVMIAAAPYCGNNVKTTYNLQAGTPDTGTPVVMGGDAPLRAGDRIMKVGGRPLPSGAAGLGTLFQIRNDTANTKAKLSVEVLRNGQPLVAQLNPVSACNYNVHLVDNKRWNAFATGNDLYVETQLQRSVRNDDDLSFVISHETAHNAAKHIDSKMGNVRIGAVLGVLADIGAAAAGIKTDGLGTRVGIAAGASAYSVPMELDADKLGMYIQYNTGYSLDAGSRVAQMMGAKNPQAIERESSHPATANRAATLQGVQREIEGQVRSGQPVRPVGWKPS